MSVPLSLIARVICQHLGVSEHDLRMGEGNVAGAARAAFAWLADALSGLERPAIALWLGIAFDQVQAWIDIAERLRMDLEASETMDDLCLAVTADHAVRQRAGGVRPDRALEAVAADALKSHGPTSAAEIRALAAGCLSLAAERQKLIDEASCRISVPVAAPPESPVIAAAQAVVDAWHGARQARHTRSETSAQRDLDRALGDLAALPELTPQLPPFKEKAHGEKGQNARH